ncbi:hypothetical protein Pmani_020449 [Petrolisthes manimaculis]|uniref:MMS19 C-terminal domain-containing protein n=1 Tax=Petrolisthes manimaculis TaxID=1843537 RepID=A0AAE1PGN1_9EUCA|nr:hypothetical protein Pmani_020449 [Petrolisthes manimaculis]
MATYLPDMMIGEEGGVGGGEVLEDIFLDTPIEGAPLTAGNSSFINDVIKDVQNDPDLGYLVLSLLIAFSWSIYIILFNARVQGTILTTILRRFVKSGDLTIGSFSLSVLSGKIMFRNVIYVTEDYSLRIVDGILKFRYWLPYVKRDLSDAHIAFCGELFDLRFTLPFTDFLPETVLLKFIIVMQELLSDPLIGMEAAHNFGTIVKDHNYALTSHTHANIRLLHKQRFFESVVGPLVELFSTTNDIKTKSCALVAIASLLPWLPHIVLNAHIQKSWSIFGQPDSGLFVQTVWGTTTTLIYTTPSVGY